ncbi:unnamed protein product [Cuscuta europaea]|uniref:Peptidase A1 domain-containing protein n=1 Tax=Cuscuta europaea TaxID=41803 RepID=A0A9P0Z894_CUSEU|nr:unnamed protein product [Cuscuta europaea]
MTSCGIRQTGAFLDSAAPNGLLGLGTDDTSVPSILAASGLAPKSFSMCFGKEGVGRILFGDKGSSNLSETPLNLDQSHPTYNISLTQIAVEGNVTNVDFTAIFDSGTSFTLLRDPAYTIITENFNSNAKEPRHKFAPDSSIPFEYCYDLSPNQTSFDVPRVYLTMKGGDQFEVFQPVELLCTKTCMYCLAIVTNGSINIIGRNDESSKQSNTTTTLPVNKQRPAAEAPSPTTIVPEATSGNGGAVPTTPPSGNNASHLKSSFFATLTLLSSLFLSLDHFF